MKHLLFVSIISAFAVACVPKQPVGSYANNYVISYSRLDLDSNNRFTYQWTEHMTGRYSQGKWERQGSDFFLNSDSIVTKANGITKEKRSDTAGFTVSFFLGDFNTPFPEIDFVINDSITGTADKQGKYFYNGYINSVYSVYLHRYHYYYQVKDSKTNHLDICLFIYVSDEIFFNKEKFVLSGSRLIGKDGSVFRKKKGLPRIPLRYRIE